ncbi:MAG: FAD-dependent oxidoreductase [Bacteroidales bacterium]|nr:FAD-dependent oxidoreductase [Lachnoclostridium sp.]MCM1465033.1 FAD-dependent oxidoreductase [Bacteroidales bacterium]
MSRKQKTAIVIGTGAGGATAAKELQGKYQVTILEAGRAFRPFGFSVKKMAKLRSSGLFFDERLIHLLLPNMVVEKSQEMVMVRGIGLGGTTTLATGNAIRYDGAIKELGINLDSQFEELYRELPITTDHAKCWTETTKEMFALFEEMDLDPIVTPKLLDVSRCVGCGHCAIGCPTGAKWDTRTLVEQALRQGARLVTGCKVMGLENTGKHVTAVHARHNGQKTVFHADLVILAAGGLGTPVILKRSGIPCGETLFVDPVVCVAGCLPGLNQDKQLLMPFISQQDGYILSPYMDYLSFFFHKDWRFPMNDLASIMIKLADDAAGGTDGKRINKCLTAEDQKRMERAVSQSRNILVRLGVPTRKQFLGILNAGHPGGMLPLTAAERDTLHNPVLPDNLYVADATILPQSMGNPPILTIMALAKKIAGIV